MNVLAVVCLIRKHKKPFGYPFFLNYRQEVIQKMTFLTITILKIIYIVRQLGKVSDRDVLLIFPRYW